MNPYEVVTTTVGDKTFRAGRRTADALDHFGDVLHNRHPYTHFHVMQPCYNSGVAASAGTHDKDCVVDIRIDGLDWWTTQRFAREMGWAAWYRHTGAWSASSDQHVHMALLPELLDLSNWTSHVGVYVPGQRDDYYRHAFGLAGEHNSGSDNSWFPDQINPTIFDWPGYLQAQEDKLPLNADDKAWLAKMVEDKVAKYVGNVVAAPTPDDPNNLIWLKSAIERILRKV